MQRELLSYIPVGSCLIKSLVLEVEDLGCQANGSSPSSAEVKNYWIYASHMPSVYAVRHSFTLFKKSFLQTTCCLQGVAMLIIQNCAQNRSK